MTVADIPWINMRGHCDGPHPEIHDGKWRYPKDRTALRKFIKSNGVVTYELVCTTEGCRFKSSPIPTVSARHLLSKLPLLDTRHTSGMKYTCGYLGCESTEVEWHHYAPRNTFGSECENFPCLPLCRDHHQHWHKTMDGYQWRARRQRRDPEEVALELLRHQLGQQETA